MFEEYLQGREAVASFCGETAISDNDPSNLFEDLTLPFYTGGLGVLEGGRYRSAYRLGLPMIGVTIRHRFRFRQRILSGGERMEFDYPKIDTGDFLEPTWKRLAIPICDTKLWADVSYLPAGRLKTIPVLFLSTWTVADNTEESKSNTEYVYGGPVDKGCTERTELAYGIVLGRGGVQAIEEFHLPMKKWHANEGWTWAMPFTLLERELLSGKTYEEAVQTVRSKVAYTNHTIMPSGNKQYPAALVAWMWGHNSPITKEMFQHLGGDPFNTAVGCMNLSGEHNGVSLQHGEMLKQNWGHVVPPDKIKTITNGKNREIWQLPQFRTVQDSLELGVARVEEKRRFLQEVIYARTGRCWSENVLTLGAGRRWQEYKRMGLIWEDLEWFREHLKRSTFQYVLAGKPHPNDRDRIDLFNYALQLSKEYSNFVVLPDYDLNLMKRTQSGVDVWVNTPVYNLEAAGTSIIGANFNGVVNLSFPAGYMWEVKPEHHFIIISDNPGDEASDARALRETTDDRVIPMYYHDRPKFLRMAFEGMKEAEAHGDLDNVMMSYWTQLYKLTA